MLVDWIQCTSTGIILNHYYYDMDACNIIYVLKCTFWAYNPHKGREDREIKRERGGVAWDRMENGSNATCGGKIDCMRITWTFFWPENCNWEIEAKREKSHIKPVYTYNMQFVEYY